jgi:hypothetical protein
MGAKTMKTFKPTEEQLHRFCGSWSVPVKYVNVLTGASPCSTQWLIDDCYRRVRKYRDDIALMIEEAKGKKIEELDLEFWRDSRDFWSAILADCTPPNDPPLAENKPDDRQRFADHLKKILEVQ